MEANGNGPSTENIIALANATGVMVEGDDPDTVSAKLVQLASDAELFHDENGEAFLSVQEKGRRETWPLKSRGVREYLAFRYHQKTKRVPGGQALQDALNVLQAKALYDGPQQATHVRIAQAGGCTYLDLADEWRNVIEIRPGSWTYVTDPPVRFRRPKGMRALPKPEAGGTLDELRKFVNVPKASSWRLVLAWLVSLFFSGPFVWLALQGRQGSGKTGTSRTLRQVIDPNKSLVRAPPRSVRDLVIGAANSVVVVLDNLSYLNEELSDALCRLSTGGGLSSRELYTDLDEIIVEVQRAGILNGITDIVARADLLDRCILIELPPLPSNARKTEAHLSAEFAAAWPRIVGAILDTVAAAKVAVPNVKLDNLPRMADFAVVGVAVEHVLCWPEGTFVADYAEAAEAAVDVAMEAFVVAPYITKLADLGGFSGTATELFDLLNEMLAGRWPKGASAQSYPTHMKQRPKGWPGSPRALSGHLRRIEETLKAKGVVVAFGQTHGEGSKKVITISKETVAQVDGGPGSPQETTQPLVAHYAPPGGFMIPMPPGLLAPLSPPVKS